ncbi:hypothetical protein GCM10009539_81250 [Cryptosporangium japonicum]|uniref:HTH tetR-type domain-containing protein n=1 Tax=Cryptosporangium japonicum TaxID=80872 RepID=A0ABN0V8P2_9ACTN
MSPESITAAALEVGDREGPKAMSMRRIAAELGCDPMALYRHFGDREALLDAVADRALVDVPAPAPDDPWDTRLRAVLGGVRAAALRHPGIAEHVAARPPLGENGQRLGAAMLSALTDSGLPPGDVVRAFQALIAYGAAALAMAVRAGRRDARWEQAADTIGALPGGERSRELPAVGSDDQFEYGLHLILAGIRAEAGWVQLGAAQPVQEPAQERAGEQPDPPRQRDEHQRPERPGDPEDTESGGGERAAGDDPVHSGREPRVVGLESGHDLVE